jgi:hypothetical protein
VSFLQLRSRRRDVDLLFFPTVTTQAATDVLTTSATGNGTVVNAGGSAVTERGFVYSTSPQPTTADTKVTSGSGTGVYSASLTGLSGGTLYHYRAYAINAIGTGYGDDVIFITVSAISAAPTYTMMGIGM